MSQIQGNPEENENKSEAVHKLVGNLKILGGLAILLIFFFLFNDNSASPQAETLAPNQPAQASPSETTPDPETELPDATEAPTDTESQEDASILMPFEANTLTGEVISNEIFQDYTLTMINIWATWCGPCVSEMPHLQRVYESLPEGTNMLTVCTDSSTESVLANEILEDSGATFQTLVDNATIHSAFTSRIGAFPTTIFVDKEGRLVGTVLQGVPAGADVAASYLSIIDQILEILPE